MKFVVVNLLAVAIFASLICRASFERYYQMDGQCPTYQRCLARNLEKSTEDKPIIKDCKCIVWGCVINKIYYNGVGCEDEEDKICKDGMNEGPPPKNSYKTNDGTLNRVYYCNLDGPKRNPTPPPPPAVDPKENDGHKDAIETTTNGSNNSKYGTWKITGMAILIGCFFFLFDGGQQQQL